MARTVLLPRNLDERLVNLTGLRQELDGSLLYQRRGDLCPLEAIFMTGAGSEGHVQAKQDRINVLNEFFRRNPDYRFVKFHTHSKGTIARFGQRYANHFSQGDITGIKEQLRNDKEFMAMLVTPVTKLLSGIDNPELVVVSDFPGYKDRSSAISGALKAIAHNLGYELRNLEATR